MVQVNKNALRVVLGALAELPGLQVTVSGDEGSAKGPFPVRVAARDRRTRDYELAVLWARSGWPTEVRQATLGIPDPWPRRLVVAAHSFSQGALEYLRKRDANWIDQAGNVRLEVPPGLIVVKIGARQETRRKPDFSWSDSSIALAELLLACRMDRITLKDLAGSAGWSAPQVSNVLRAFDQKEWTTRHGPPRGRGVWRELSNPGAMLEAWSAHLVDKRPQRRRGHRLLRDPLRFLRDELAPLLSSFGDWAVTGWAGLEIVAPYVDMVPSLQIYMPTREFHAGVTPVFEEGKIREVQEGGNIEVWEMEFPLVVGDQTAGSVPVTNLPRLYSDLLAIGGRAEDGAMHLRETAIGY